MYAAESATGGPAPPPSDEVRKQLRRILEGPEVVVRGRRGGLLRYLVEEALAGHARSLKGVSIAIAVFDRDETFDQQTDPIVRLEARRLRHDLDTYYATAGRYDPIRISIPKGGYVPLFEWQQVEAPAAPASITSPRWLLYAASLLALILVVVLLWRVSDLIHGDAMGNRVDFVFPKGPSIAVMPFINLSGESEKQYLSDGITEQLTTELARFRDIRVLPLGTAQLLKDGLADPQQIRREFGTDFVLEGSVRASGETIRITSRLIEAQNARYVWVKSFEEPFRPANIYEVQDTIAQEVAANVGGKYGVMAHALMARSTRKAPDSLEAYDCVLRYYQFQITMSAERHAEVKACLERAVALDPSYAEAWAVLANVYMQEKRFGIGVANSTEETVNKARVAVARAIELDPAEPTGHIVLSNLLFTEGDLDGFQQSGETALRLNPNNSDALAHYGLRLALRGDWDHGLLLVNKAMALNPAHPHWYQFAQVIYHYDRGEYELALAELANIDMPNFIWTHLLTVATLGQLERYEEAGKAARALLALDGDIEVEASRFLRVWQLPEPLYERIMAGLGKAGLNVR
jgi:adenylate cyclase